MRDCVERCGLAFLGGRRSWSRLADRCDPSATLNSESLERVPAPAFEIRRCSNFGSRRARPSPDGTSGVTRRYGLAWHDRLRPGVTR